MFTNYPLGLIGGMGSLASAAFIQEFYKRQSKFITSEQEYLNTLIFNIADMPDRSASIKKGDTRLLVSKLTEVVEKMQDMEVKRIYILCYTFHSLIKYLAPHHKANIMSLVDATLAQVIRFKKKAILLATTITNHYQIFESSKLWPEAKSYIIKLKDEHQITIQQIIYALKMNSNNLVFEYISDLLNYYKVDSWIIGCTEFFILLDNPNKKLGNIIHPIDEILLNYWQPISKYNNAGMDLCVEY